MSLGHHTTSRPNCTGSSRWIIKFFIMLIRMLQPEYKSHVAFYTVHSSLLSLCGCELAATIGLPDSRRLWTELLILLKGTVHVRATVFIMGQFITWSGWDDEGSVFCWDEWAPFTKVHEAGWRHADYCSGLKMYQLWCTVFRLLFQFWFRKRCDIGSVS